MKSRAKDMIMMMRPQQWVKNLFIFPALIFSKQLFNTVMLGESVSAFLIFCMLSGSVYIINDIVDIDLDRHHPRKRQRPIASGRVPIPVARVTHVALALAAMGLAFSLNREFGFIALVYYLMNLSYTFWLKRVVIVDVLVVAAGFVIRAAAGGFAIGVQVSNWLFICTSLIALFLVLAKRRHELLVADERNTQLMELSLAIEDTKKAVRFRHSLEEYSTYFLDQMIAVVTASTLVSYVLYTLSDEATAKFGSNGLVYTTPFVIYGIFRYLYLIHRKREGGSPTHALISDKPLLAGVAMWGAAVVYISYCQGGA